MSVAELDLSGLLLPATNRKSQQSKSGQHRGINFWFRDGRNVGSGGKGCKACWR